MWKLLVCVFSFLSKNVYPFLSHMGPARKQSGSIQHLFYTLGGKVFSKPNDTEKKFFSFYSANQLDCPGVKYACVCVYIWFAGAFITSEWFYLHQRIIYSAYTSVYLVWNSACDKRNGAASHVALISDAISSAKHVKINCSVYSK